VIVYVGEVETFKYFQFSHLFNTKLISRSTSQKNKCTARSPQIVCWQYGR